MSTLTDGFNSLFARVNKAKGDGKPDEGVVLKLGELTLEKTDDELIGLAKEWEKAWTESTAYKHLTTDGDECRKYWLGKSYPESEYTKGRRPPADNIIFESSETFLPLVTQKNPQPIVTTDNTPEGQELNQKITLSLSWLADKLNMRMRIKKGVRLWMIYFLGAWKVGYNYVTNEIDLYTIKPKKLILDPNAFIEDGEYTGDFIGESKEETARSLIVKFPEKEKEIKELCEDKLGTIMAYTEWWTDDYVFWKLKSIILHKAKNPHWNYDKTKDTVDDFGKPIQSAIPGKNHFGARKKPYVFLNVFSLEESPVDETSLIHQNLSGQDLINKRLKQVDKNADGTNGGAVVSGQFFNKDQAAKVGDALAQGKTVVVPTGDINQAYKRDMAPALPSFVFESMVDMRTRVLDRFGVRGASSQGSLSEKTVRGKVIAQNQDSSRTGGGITDHVEQVAQKIYDWFIQLMYVYYDTPHYASFMGTENAIQYVALTNQDLNKKISVTVEEGSLLPKDELTQRNEAMDLWTAGALDPITLFERLHFPNPKETAMKLFQWKSNPMSLFGEGGDMSGGMPVQGPDLNEDQTDPNAVNKTMEPPVEQPEGSEPTGQVENQLIKSVPLQQ